MPRISAATVVEHRRQVNEKLMDAASSLLAKQTVSDIEAPLKVGEIAKEAGIARSSFYRYYNTVDDLVAALVLRDFPEWKVTVATSVKKAKDPVSAVRAFVRANISMASDSKHAWRTAVFSYHFHQDAQREIGAIHAELHDILVVAITELDSLAESHGYLVARTIQNIVNSAVTAVETLSLNDEQLDTYIAWHEEAVEAILVSASTRATNPPPRDASTQPLPDPREAGQ